MRLIDLHVGWLRQYAPETALFEPEMAGAVAGRLGQVEGYLQGTWAAVVACGRSADERARRAGPWAALGEMIARVEAEFPGRLLIGPDDLARWLDDPEGLCWGLIGVDGLLDDLIRGPADLDRLAPLFGRGARLFQLAGPQAEGDDRGLTGLGRDVLQALADLAGDVGPRPMLDLARLGSTAADDVLDWFEADANRADRLIPVSSHGALDADTLARLRALGGVVGLGVGPPSFETADQLRAAIASAAELPFLGRPGVEGLAIGTDFLGADRTIPGLGHAAEVAAWLAATFPPAEAEALIRGNARRLLIRALSGSGP